MHSPRYCEGSLIWRIFLKAQEDIARLFHFKKGRQHFLSDSGSIIQASSKV